MVDTRDLKSLGSNTVWVRVPPEALEQKNTLKGCFFVCVEEKDANASFGWDSKSFAMFARTFVRVKPQRCTAPVGSESSSDIEPSSNLLILKPNLTAASWYQSSLGSPQFGPGQPSGLNRSKTQGTEKANPLHPHPNN